MLGWREQPRGAEGPLHVLPPVHFPGETKGADETQGEQGTERRSWCATGSCGGRAQIKGRMKAALCWGSSRPDNLSAKTHPLLVTVMSPMKTRRLTVAGGHSWPQTWQEAELQCEPRPLGPRSTFFRRPQFTGREQPVCISVCRERAGKGSSEGEGQQGHPTGETGSQQG